MTNKSTCITYNESVDSPKPTRAARGRELRLHLVWGHCLEARVRAVGRTWLGVDVAGGDSVLLPLQSLDAFGRMKDGQAMLLPNPNGVQVVVVAGTRSQPLTEDQARPIIEQYLLNERKRKLVEDDVKAMRAAAKIEYVGKFAQPAASAPAGAPAPAPAASAGLSNADITKGMGLK